MSGLSLRHFKAFATVAQAAHFGRAAAQLEITQPLLSQMISRLEQVVGHALFVRRPQVRLTVPGEILLPFANRALAELDAGVAAAVENASGVQGNLNLGFPTLLSFSWLPEAIAAYHRDYPAVRISYLDLTTTDQLKALAAGQLDVAFVRQEASDAEGVTMLPIDTEPLVLALSAGHRLTSREHISASELAAEPFILFPRHTAPRLFDSIIGGVRAAGVELNLVREARDWLTVVGLVRAGAGLSFIPISLAEIGLPGLSFRRVAGLDLQTTLSMARATIDRNPVVGKFIEAVEAHARARTSRSTTG